MKKFINEKYSIFLTSLIQVSLVAMNVNFISKGLVIPMLITGFSISLVWTFNIKKMAFGNWSDRIVYSVGATIGTGLGYIISHTLSKML